MYEQSATTDEINEGINTVSQLEREWKVISDDKPIEAGKYNEYNDKHYSTIDSFKNQHDQTGNFIF